jgi:hypothetical protein
MLWLLRLLMLLLLLEDALLEKLFWRYILLYQFSTALQVMGIRQPHHHHHHRRRPAVD